MKKFFATVLLFAGVLLGSLGMASAAQAYGNDTPPSVTPPHTHSQAGTPTSSGVLPNTGGPNVLLLGGALVLIVAGGVVLVTRRRAAETD